MTVGQYWLYKTKLLKHFQKDFKYLAEVTSKSEKIKPVGLATVKLHSYIRQLAENSERYF